MTIAAGFVACDGVLLCTDSLYSGGIKVMGKKIFPFQVNGGAIVFALAGHEPFAKRAVEECLEHIERHPNSHGSIPNVKAVIETALLAFYRRFVFSRPQPEREHVRFNLLIAIADMKTASLFSSNETVLTPVPGKECFGAGYFVGHHIIENAYNSRMTVDDAAVLAIHAVAMAKEYVEGVGGPTQLVWVRDGIVSPVHPINSAIFTENYILTFERESAELLFHAANPRLSEEDFQRCAAQFVQYVSLVRKHWRESFENQDLLQMLVHPEAAPDLQSTKGAQNAAHTAGF